MLILAIADIHGALEVYEWPREAAAEYRADLLILAGDLLIGGWEDQQFVQARTVIIPFLRTILVPVYYVMGNDDNVDLGDEDEKIKPVHGKRVDLGVCSIAGYQYSTPFVGGCYEEPEEEIAADLHQIETIVDESIVLVTHSAAYG